MMEFEIDSRVQPIGKREGPSASWSGKGGMAAHTLTESPLFRLPFANARKRQAAFILKKGLPPACVRAAPLVRAGLGSCSGRATENFVPELPDFLSLFLPLQPVKQEISDKHAETTPFRLDACRVAGGGAGTGHARLLRRTDCFVALWQEGVVGGRDD